MEEAIQAIEFQHDREFLSRVVPLMETYGRYFDAEVRGLEHLPDSGPVLLVGNHSGPNCDPDTPALMAAWYRKNGVDNPLVVLSYAPIFAVPKIGNFFRRDTFGKRVFHGRLVHWQRQRREHRKARQHDIELVYGHSQG